MTHSLCEIAAARNLRNSFRTPVSSFYLDFFYLDFFYLDKVCNGQWQTSMIMAARVLVQILEHVDDLFNLTGFVEEIVRPQAEAFFPVFRRGIVCQHDDLELLPAPLDVFQQFDSTAFRHAHVEYRHVG